MRSIDKIIVHCRASGQSVKARDIVAYHLRPVSLGGRGWRVAGYHYIIEADGKIVNTVDEAQVSNGCYGQNQRAINVCYVGGVDTSKKGLPPIDNRTPQQKAALLTLLKQLRRKYPQAKIYWHRDFANKACPSFHAKTEYKDL